MMELEYVVSWTTTETVDHVAIVSAETYARMIDVPVATLAAASLSDEAVRDIRGGRELADGLAPIESAETETGENDSLNREVRHVFVRPRRTV